MSMIQNKNMNPGTLQNIPIEIGMPRAEVEKRVADALHTESTYNVYEGSTVNVDQTITYTDGVGTLEVVYNHGSPAPWVTNASGVAEHYPPVDQTVKSFKYVPK